MDKIPLSEMLGQLRNELVQAQGAAEGSDLKLLIEDVEVQLHVATTKGGKGGGGVKFWVYNAEAEVNASEAKTQRITLKLKAVRAEDDSPYNVGDEDQMGG